MADRRRIGHESLRRELRTAEKRIRQLRKELKALAGAEQGDEL